MEVWTLAMTLVSPGRKRSKSWSFLARYYLLTRLADVDFIASGSWKDRAHCLDFPQERPTGSLLSWGNDQVSEKLQHDFCLTTKAWFPVLWSRKNLRQCLPALCPKSWRYVCVQLHCTYRNMINSDFYRSMWRSRQRYSSVFRRWWNLLEIALIVNSGCSWEECRQSSTSYGDCSRWRGKLKFIAVFKVALPT